MSRRGSWTVYKSAATGRYVTRAEAEADPERTYGVLVGPVKAAAVTVAARYTKGRRTN